MLCTRLCACAGLGWTTNLFDCRGPRGNGGLEEEKEKVSILDDDIYNNKKEEEEENGAVIKRKSVDYQSNATSEWNMLLCDVVQRAATPSFHFLAIQERFRHVYIYTYISLEALFSAPSHTGRWMTSTLSLAREKPLNFDLSPIDLPIFPTASRLDSFFLPRFPSCTIFLDSVRGKKSFFIGFKGGGEILLGKRAWKSANLPFPSSDINRKLSACLLRLPPPPPPKRGPCSSLPSFSSGNIFFFFFPPPCGTNVLQRRDTLIRRQQSFLPVIRYSLWSRLEMIKHERRGRWRRRRRRREDYPQEEEMRGRFLRAAVVVTANTARSCSSKLCGGKRLDNRRSERWNRKSISPEVKCQQPSLYDRTGTWGPWLSST